MNLLNCIGINKENYFKANQAFPQTAFTAGQSSISVNAFDASSGSTNTNIHKNKKERKNKMKAEK
jgi:hypothetical protein